MILQKEQFIPVLILLLMFCMKNLYHSIFIYLPNESEAKFEAELFYEHNGFPPIAWGAIDGTHIPVSFTKLGGVRRVCIFR